MLNELYLHVIRVFERKKLLQRISHVKSTNIGSAASFINRLPVNELTIKIGDKIIIDSPLKSSVLDAVHSVVNYKIIYVIVQLETSKLKASKTTSNQQDYNDAKLLKKRKEKPIDKRKKKKQQQC